MKFRMVIIEAEGEEAIQAALRATEEWLGPKQALATETDRAGVPQAPETDHLEETPLAAENSQTEVTVYHPPKKKPGPAPMGKSIAESLHGAIESASAETISLVEWGAYPIRKATKKLGPCFVCARPIRKAQEYRDPPGKPEKRAHRDCILKKLLEKVGSEAA